ncbi:MAG TPA: penicillin-binding protein 2 [Pyrinomonadaceae bacterium]|jgi:penicillin-binding protein 2
MKFDDHSQNLPARIGAIQVIAFVLLALLGVRLYYLQIVKGDQYKERAENQRVRLLPIPAPRGAILDRQGRVMVDSRQTYNVVLSREEIKNRDINSLLPEYADGLSIDEETLREKLDFMRLQPAFESLVIKENATLEDLAWAESHQIEHPELRVEIHPQRFYPLGTIAAHTLGYVGEISPKQLQEPRFIERGLRPGDIIGKEGLEAAYDQYLRGRDGFRKVVVDSRGRIQEEIEVVQPQPGQDLVTTIDLDLQKAAEQKLAESVTKRGVLVAMDPNNGEILVMASAPSFDPNVMVNKVSTKEGRREIAALYNDPQKPLLNRAIRGRYPPGSTWKIPESVAALQQGVITVEKSNMVCGGGITTGSKFTRCMGNHGSPPLSYAITKSCDGYYYRLALKMGIDGLIKMVETFEYDKPTGVDLPGEYTTRTPKFYRPIIEKRDGRWNDVETVFASIGQVTVQATPISMLRAIASLGVGGKMFVPHLMKEAREAAVMGEPGESGYWEARPLTPYLQPAPKIIEMTPAQNKVIVEGMWGAVNAGGTAAGIKMQNWEIAGKTGTAQVVGLGKDTGANKDHAWFVSFAPAYKPEIAIIGLIENSGFGGRNAAPAARGIYEAYIEKHHPQLLSESEKLELHTGHPAN